jgi:hypothetical protein
MDVLPVFLVVRVDLEDFGIDFLHGTAKGDLVRAGVGHNLEGGRAVLVAGGGQLSNGVGIGGML